MVEEELQRRIVGGDDRRLSARRVARLEQGAHLREQLLAAPPGVQELDRQIDLPAVALEPGPDAPGQVIGPFVADVVGVDHQDAAGSGDLGWGRRLGGRNRPERQPQACDDRERQPT